MQKNQLVINHLKHEIVRFWESGNFATKKQSYKFWRIEIPLIEGSIEEWFASNSGLPKIFWSNKDNSQVILGIDILKVVCGDKFTHYSQIFQEMDNILNQSHSNIRFFGGSRFNPEILPSKGWEKFCVVRFFIPRIEIIKTKSQFKLALNIELDDKDDLETLVDYLDEKLASFNFKEKLTDLYFSECISRFDYPNKGVWFKNIMKVLGLLEKKEMDKIVLARKSDFKFSEVIDDENLFLKLLQTTPNSYHFYLKPDKHNVFMGATPELLYSRKGNKIYAEAIAGTRARSTDCVTDRQLEEELISSEKEIAEHQWVVDHVNSTLKLFCQHVEVKNHRTVIKLSNVQHLLTKFFGTLTEDFSDSDLLSKLHPTPAVGGVPVEKAVSFIDELEPFDRGWYAGPIGWVGQNEAEFVVAIRSARVYKNILSIFAGGGIVKGSEPEAEWNEIENKILNYTNILFKT